jgi:hypothetical protein
VRSKSELVISNVLYRMGVNYQYEPQLEGEIERGKVRPYCSFTDPGDDLKLGRTWACLDEPTTAKGGRRHGTRRMAIH